MIDATGRPQSLLVLGGASEIAQAVVDRVVEAGCHTVVLAGRPSPRLDDAAGRATDKGAKTVEIVAFDATEVSSHSEVIGATFDKFGDLDVVLVTAGQLGDQETLEHDPDGTAALITTNFTGLAAALVAVSERMRRQGHGRIVVLSSVAGDRPRRANFAYGSTKSGLDAFAQGLGDALTGSGVGVTVVRPGFVVGRMTAGMEPAPLATTPEAVADAIMRMLPRPIWRRLPG